MNLGSSDLDYPVKIRCKTTGQVHVVSVRVMLQSPYWNSEAGMLDAHYEVVEEVS